MNEGTKNGISILLAILIPTIVVMVIVFSALKDYQDSKIKPISNEINSMLNASTRFNNDTILSQQDRIDLLVKNHAISIDKQSQITILQKQETEIMSEYWYVAIITPFATMIISMYITRRWYNL